MSFLRLASPGLPTVLVDQGPATGRISFTRYGIRGGSLEGAMVVGVSRPPAKTHERLPRRLRPKHAVCGLPIGRGTCARRPDHGWDCRTRQTMDKDAAGRRAMWARP